MGMKIIFEDYEAERQKAIDDFNANPDFNYRHAPFMKGNKYWVRIEVNDDIDSRILLQMLYAPETIEGFDKLGFNITDISFEGIVRKDEIKEKLLNYIDNEL